MSKTVQYTDMKDSGIKWIGSVPASWNVRTLYQLVTRVNCKNSDLAEQNLLSLSYGKIKRKDINTNDGLLPASFDGYNIIEAGDIVLRLTDLQNDHTSLRVGHATERGIITSAYTTLRPINPAHSRYLYYLIHAFDLKKGFYGMGSGVRQGLNYDEVKELRIVLPSQEEQDAITKFLDKMCSFIDDTVVEAKSFIDESSKWRTSLIYEIVTNGINPNMAKKKSSIQWIKEIPAHWEIKKIKFLPNNEENAFEDGDWIESPYITDSGIRYLTTGNIGDGKFKRQGNGYISIETFNKLNCKYAYPGDLVFSRLNAPYGRSCILPDDFPEYVLAVDNVILRTDESKKYISYVTQCPGYQETVLDKAAGTTMKRISRTNLGNISIPLPPKVEQDGIAEYLDKKCTAIDLITDELCELIDALEQYKRSLIYEVVTGKRKVV